MAEQQPELTPEEQTEIYRKLAAAWAVAPPEVVGAFIVSTAPGTPSFSLLFGGGPSHYFRTAFVYAAEKVVQRWLDEVLGIKREEPPNVDRNEVVLKPEPPTPQAPSP